MTDNDLTMDAMIGRADTRMSEALLGVLDLAAGHTAVLVASAEDLGRTEPGQPVEPEALALDVVARIAPGELPLFHTFTQRVETRSGRSRRRGGDKVLGFGLAEVVEQMVTPVAVLAAADVVHYLAAIATKTGAEGLRRKRRRSGQDDSSGTALTFEQAEEVRQLVQEAARRAGLSAERCEELADAIVDGLNDTTG